ncbi:MAG: DUF2155 domain-containing protein [Bacteroidales bacterium]|nr:DUF2155 domain-containing protein [Bacteroidales bacterium]
MKSRRTCVRLPRRSRHLCLAGSIRRLSGRICRRPPGRRTSWRPPQPTQAQPSQSLPPQAPRPGPAPQPATPSIQTQTPPSPAGAVPPGSEDFVVVAPPAQRIENRTATFNGLDKITGRIIVFDAAIGETVQFGALQVTARACYTRPPTEAPNTTGFVEVDERQRTSVAGVYAAGEVCGIGGVDIAIGEGLVAGGAECRVDRTLREILRRSFRLRNELRTLTKPETLVCRCEEVTAAEVRSTADMGCEGPNQMKAFLRCGMGPCQGRMCGLAVSEVIARQRGENMDTVDYYRIRPPLKPWRWRNWPPWTSPTLPPPTLPPKTWPRNRRPCTEGAPPWRAIGRPTWWSSAAGCTAVRPPCMRRCAACR